MAGAVAGWRHPRWGGGCGGLVGQMLVALPLLGRRAAGAVAALVGIGMAGGLSRSGGISGGGIGGWPLISSGPLALFSNVAQPPLPSVAPMLHATSWLPADQLGNEMVL
ncbi:hypothetical protein I552_8504 [Mycobacterium xenopi 3993]|nr:hypothetical protein I552_8504 [Mycobacterium xenopi 3993]